MNTQVDEQAQQRLQGLTELYNVADDAKTQHMLLRQAIAYATKANLANLLGPVIKVQIAVQKCLLALAFKMCLSISAYGQLLCNACACFAYNTVLKRH